MSDGQPSSDTEPAPVACPHCGSANPAGFRFCGSCGAPLERTCPSCGAVSPATFRFCGNCGGPLVEMEPGAQELEERKVVTVLFADLEASTELAIRLDPEDLRGLLRTFFEAMTEEIARFDGTIEKFIGDAVVAVFGAPAAHEDDPERAVRAALAMQVRLGRLNERLRQERAVELAMRIGVNTGEVLTATGIDREGLVTGEPVNLAARLESLAAPGTVVVGERTQRDTRHAFRFRSLGEVAVKGFDRPVRAWEVAGEHQHRRSAGGEFQGPMVGRDSELELLSLVLSRTAREGRPHLVTLVGPAGIGKSRLSHEFATSVRETDPSANVVRGRCLPYGSGLTYWPLAEILKSDAGIMDSDPPDTMTRKAGDQLALRLATDDKGSGTVPVLLSSIGVPVHPDPLSGAPAEVARELIARAWRAYLESLAAGGPLVALIEDIHWADPSLLDLLENLAARVAAPVVLVAMARPELWERRPSWGGGLRSATTVIVSPLSEDESRDLLTHLLGEGHLPTDELRPVLERAEGNPFFAQELLRMLVDEGYLARDGTRWRLERNLPASLPDTVQGVIASRIDRLPAAEKRAIQDAAVVGRLFWQGTLGRLGSSDPARAIDGLVEKDLVWEREGSVIEGERELIFNHILTRDVAYQSIPRARRSQAHREAMAWMEEVTAGRSEEFAEILAYHAERAGDSERTARYSMLAGHRSRRVFAAEEAIRWYERALSAAESVEPASAGPLQAESAVSKGEALEQLGRFQEAETEYRRSLERARSADVGQIQARALSALAHVLWLLDRFEEGQQVLEEALAKAREVGATHLLSRLLYTAGTISFGRGDFRDALKLHEEALAVAKEQGDLEGEAWARHGLCETRYFLGPFEQGLAEGLEADRLLRELGQRPMVYHNQYMVGFLLWQMGRLSEAIPVAEEALAGAREVGDRRNEAFALAGRFLVSESEGDPATAIEAMEQTVQMSRELRTPRLEASALGFGASVLMDVGLTDRAREFCERALALTEEMQSTFAKARLFALMGWTDVRRGDVGSARTRFEEARELAEGVLTEELISYRAELCAWEDAGRPDELADAAERLRAVAEGESPKFLAWAHYGLARAATMRGQVERSAEEARRAIELGERSGEANLEWRARHALARALEGQQRMGEAAAEARRAGERIDAVLANLPQDVRSALRTRSVYRELRATRDRLGA